MFTLTIESNATVKVNRRPVSAQPLLRTLSNSFCQSAFLSILALSSQVHAQSASKPQFVWKQNSAYQALDKVRFANGEVAIVKQDLKQSRGNEPDLFGNRLYVGKEGELRPQTDPGRLVAIEAAYPSASNAKVAIASTNCGGTMCGRYSDYFVVFIGEHGLRTAAIGTGFYAPKGHSQPRMNSGLMATQLRAASSATSSMAARTIWATSCRQRVATRSRASILTADSSTSTRSLSGSTPRAFWLMKQPEQQSFARSTPQVTVRTVSHERPWVVDCHQWPIRGHERMHGPLLQLGIRFCRVGRIFGRHPTTALRCAYEGLLHRVNPAI